MTEIKIDPATASGLFEFSTTLVGVVIIWLAIMTILMPLYVWGCYKQLKRNGLLLRGIIDELRLNRPPPKIAVSTR